MKVKIIRKLVNVDCIVRCIYKMLDFVRNHPEYLHLFQLHKEIEAMQGQEE